MGRISRQAMFMMMARAASLRSTCFRLNVGAIITKDNRPISVGWNGQAPGAPHCKGNSCPGVKPGYCGTTHAEINAIHHAMGHDPFGGNWDLYVTDSPCKDCAYEIVSCGSVKRVFYEKPYRVLDGLQVLDEGEIEVYNVTPAGYIVEHFTREVVELP